MRALSFIHTRVVSNPYELLFYGTQNKMLVILRHYSLLAFLFPQIESEWLSFCIFPFPRSNYSHTCLEQRGSE